MADTMFSSLSAAAAAAAADYLIGLQSGAAVKFTAAQLKTFHNTAPVIAAGTASADTWPIHTAGTLLTTPKAGAYERDATNVYDTTEDSNRGIRRIDHFIRANSTRTFTSNTSAQAIFNSPSNGALTLGTGVYLYDALIGMDTMSATQGNGKWSIAGTAALSQLLAQITGADAAFETVAAGSQHSTALAAMSGNSVANTSTATELLFGVRGTFTVTSSGTIIPSFALTTAAAAVVKIGSWFRCWREGAQGVISVGNWS